MVVSPSNWHTNEQKVKHSVSLCTERALITSIYLHFSMGGCQGLSEGQLCGVNYLLPLFGSFGLDSGCQG